MASIYLIYVMSSASFWFRLTARLQAQRVETTGLVITVIQDFWFQNSFWRQTYKTILKNFLNPSILVSFLRV